MNTKLNKSVKKFLDDYLKDEKKNSPEHQESVMLIMRGALTDANFHSEAKQLGKYFPKAGKKYIGTPMEDVIESKGIAIAKAAKWDGHDIIDAFAFYLSMSIGGSFGNRLMSLKESIEESLVEEGEKLDEKNVPTDSSKWSYYKAQAKKKFDVYPSAYANGWAAKQYKKAGGGWKTESVNEGYGEFIKAKNLTDIIKLSKQKKNATFYVTDDNNSRIGAFYLKNGKFAKVTTANPNYDLQNNKTKLRDRSDVIYKYKVDESVNEAPTKRSNDFFNDSKHGKAIYKLLGGNPFKAGKVKKYLDTLLDKLGDQKGIRVWDFIGKDVGLDVRKYGSQPVRKYEFALIGAIDDLYHTHIKESVNEAKDKVFVVMFKVKKDLSNRSVKPSSVAYAKEADAKKFLKSVEKDGGKGMIVKSNKPVGVKVNEAATRTAVEIGGLTGVNKDAIQKFVDDNKLDIEKVYQFVKKGKLADRMKLVSAIAGKPNNPVQKKMVKQFGEGIIKEAKVRLGKDSVNFKVMGDSKGLTLIAASGNDLDGLQGAVENDVDVKEELRKTLEKQLKVPVEVDRGYDGAGFRFNIDFYSLAKKVK